MDGREGRGGEGKWWLPDKAPRSVTHPLAVSSGVRAMAWCFSRPESAYITFDLSCTGACEEGGSPGVFGGG